MKKELDELLCKKYPEIFRDRHGDKLTTCMCWGFEVDDGWFDIIDTLCETIQHHITTHNWERKRSLEHNAMVEAVRAGDLTTFNEKFKDVSGEWKEKYLQGILSNKEENQPWGTGIRQVSEPLPQVVAVQVKEKFATLRFYVMDADDTVYGMIRYAEALSGRVCEVCGSPGKTVGKGWIKTLCPAHYREGDEGTEREIKWKLITDEE